MDEPKVKITFDRPPDLQRNAEILIEIWKREKGGQK